MKRWLRVWWLKLRWVISFRKTQLRVTPPRVADIKTQLSKHEVTFRSLDPIDFGIIALDAMAWKQFINELTGPTWVVLSPYTLGNIIVIVCIYPILLVNMLEDKHFYNRNLRKSKGEGDQKSFLQCINIGRVEKE